jgi:homoserine kinase type II
MAVYTHVTNDDLAQLAQLYGFASIDKALPIAEGVENSNYMLHVTAKDKSRFKAILTLFEARVNSHDIPFYMCLKEHLAGAGIPCPKPYRANGKVSVKIAGKHAVIVSFMEGASILKPTTAHIREVGAALAQMHIATRDFPMTRPNAMSFTGWHELRSRIAAKSIDDDSLQTLDVIHHELLYLARAWNERLPAGIIHADMFPNNVFFNSKGKLSAVIDFYFACHDVLAYDLAIVANAWCANDDGNLRHDDYHALIESYNAVRLLTEEEHRALPMLLRAAALRFLLTRQHDMLYPNEDALLIPHNPQEYLRILQAHQQSR